MDFLIGKRTTNVSYYSKLLEDRADQPFIQNDEVDQSKASVSSTATRVRTPPL
jgi:hypothetical protein